MSMNIPENCKYTKEHEWIRVEGKEIVVGISDYAQIELGDLVYVDLPAVGNEVKKGASLGTVESVKAVSDVYAPISGVIRKINEQLASVPQLLNEAPYTQGWLVALEPKDLKELDDLMDAKAYRQYLLAISK